MDSNCIVVPLHRANAFVTKSERNQLDSFQGLVSTVYLAMYHPRLVCDRGGGGC